MTDLEIYEKAKALMIDAHHNRTRPENRTNELGYQVNKAGVDYIYHPFKQDDHLIKKYDYCIMANVRKVRNGG